ncbi:hypothetical protein GCM10010275_40380 [Streptomyces litmocidini]|nr:hypothetical protein GCM10010275_40380 [Streptomyces litmocidini]
MSRGDRRPTAPVAARLAGKRVGGPVGCRRAFPGGASAAPGRGAAGAGGPAAA